MEPRCEFDNVLKRGSNLAGVDLRVEYIAPERLQPAARQVRKRSARQTRAIARSLTEFGFVVPMLVDARLSIVAGHGRWEAAKLLGLSRVPIIRVEHLTEAQLRLLSIADNKLPEGVTWDRDALLLEFKEIEINAPELDITTSGWLTPEIDKLYGLQRADRLSDFDDATEPDAGVPPTSVVGDLWQLGRHRLVCGDARDPGVIARVVDGKPVQMLLTDPPWNLAIPGVVSKSHDNFVMASGEMSKGQFTIFLSNFLVAALPALVDGALLYVFLDWRNLDALMAAATRQHLEQKNLLVWCKHSAGMGSLYRSQHELIGLYKLGTAAHVNNIELGRYGRNRSNVLMYPGVGGFTKGRKKALATHPTCKPIALLADLMLDATNRGDVVLDCFGGSGSTLIAAEKTDRVACLAELDPKYVDAIVQRFEAATGQIAIELGSGQTFAALGESRRAAVASVGPTSTSTWKLAVSDDE